ncbi:hypothetical protein H312_02569 [Anncaliia algerae PRA339]|uniref:Uncharacterized protein n=1 Tax=Anncaliia algerae PRA339 TaxID=1288291 RepID=A0A059EYQ3_9MICR|nr:hypothetical protein H312_02569 [Anncaliia algerae PRA339]
MTLAMFILTIAKYFAATVGSTIDSTYPFHETLIDGKTDLEHKEYAMGHQKSSIKETNLTSHDLGLRGKKDISDFEVNESHLVVIPICNDDVLEEDIVLNLNVKEIRTNDILPDITEAEKNISCFAEDIQNNDEGRKITKIQTKNYHSKISTSNENTQSLSRKRRFDEILDQNNSPLSDVKDMYSNVQNPNVMILCLNNDPASMESGYRNDTQNSLKKRRIDNETGDDIVIDLSSKSSVIYEESFRTECSSSSYIPIDESINVEDLSEKSALTKFPRGINAIQNFNSKDLQVLDLSLKNSNFKSSLEHHRRRNINLSNSLHGSLKMYPYEPLNYIFDNNKTSNIGKDVYLHYEIIQEDNKLIFPYIINRLGPANLRLNYKVDNSRRIAIQGYLKLYSFLIQSFEVEAIEIDSSDIFKILYEKYEKYKISLSEVYNYQKIEGKEHHDSQIKNYRDKIGYSEGSEQRIFEWNIKILETKNYNILFKILPFFNLFNIIKRNIVNDALNIKSIRYIHIIICKLEAFKYNYFVSNGIEEETIGNLFLNQNFNETLLIICELLKRLMSLHNVSCHVLRFMEFYNFIYFIKVKYSEIYEQNNLNDFFTHVDKQISDILQNTNSQNIPQDLINVLQSSGYYDLYQSLILNTDLEGEVHKPKSNKRKHNKRSEKL